MALFFNDPTATAQTTGISRSARTPETCCALSARSSPSTPAVFLAATLVITATSSRIVAISSSRARRLAPAISGFRVSYAVAGRIQKKFAYPGRAPRAGSAPLDHHLALPGKERARGNAGHAAPVFSARAQLARRMFVRGIVSHGSLLRRGGSDRRLCHAAIRAGLPGRGNWQDQISVKTAVSGRRDLGNLALKSPSPR